MSNTQRLKELKAQAASMEKVPLGLSISIAKLESEINPEEDENCIMCSG